MEHMNRAQAAHVKAAAQQAEDLNARGRLCEAEIRAVLEKYKLDIAITRTEVMAPGGNIQIVYGFSFVPPDSAPSLLLPVGRHG